MFGIRFKLKTQGDDVDTGVEFGWLECLQPLPDAQAKTGDAPVEVRPPAIHETADLQKSREDAWRIIRHFEKNYPRFGWGLGDSAFEKLKKCRPQDGPFVLRVQEYRGETIYTLVWRTGGQHWAWALSAQRGSGLYGGVHDHGVLEEAAAMEAKVRELIDTSERVKDVRNKQNAEWGSFVAQHIGGGAQ